MYWRGGPWCSGESSPLPTRGCVRRQTEGLTGGAGVAGHVFGRGLLDSWPSTVVSEAYLIMNMRLLSQFDLSRPVLSWGVCRMQARGWGCMSGMIACEEGANPEYHLTGRESLIRCLRCCSRCGGRVPDCPGSPHRMIGSLDSEGHPLDGGLPSGVRYLYVAPVA